MSADDNPPAGQADIGEALVAALGFEPTDDVKRGNGSDGSSGGGSGASGGSGGSGARSGGGSGQRRSKKSRRKNRSRGGQGRSGSGSANGGAKSGRGSGGGSSAKADAGVAGDGVDGAEGADGDGGAGSPIDSIKSAAKPAISDRSTIVVGVDEDLDDGWVAVEAKAEESDGAAEADTDETDGVAGTTLDDPTTEADADPAVDDGDASDESGPNEQANGRGEAAGNGKSTDDSADEASSESTPNKSGSTKSGSNKSGSNRSGSNKSGSKKGERSAPTDAAADDDTVVVSGPPAGEPVSTPIGGSDPVVAAAGVTADDATMVTPVSEVADLRADGGVAGSGAVGVTAEVVPGMASPSAPPIVGEAPGVSPLRVESPETEAARTGEIQRVETRDDEIQAARLDAESRAREAGREVFRQGSWINLFRRSRRLQSRKVRRVIRHVDPWSVLTFSVLFHLCVFAALLLASVLVWNAAEAAGTIEDLEGFILELGDYETFEIKGDVVFRAAVAIAGILTLASSVLVVLLTVVFNLISDLVGGIRLTVIEEETVRVRRRSARADAGPGEAG